MHVQELKSFIHYFPERPVRTKVSSAESHQTPIYRVILKAIYSTIFDSVCHPLMPSSFPCDLSKQAE